ncbi:delphilin-like isoform X2 [Corticium candelabrum]|uniref:delphilin-like isoform X2 n=1 Tax=Corticium candelabrum TaxID=121492 RepID=UPI002E36E5BE|nr:delphilin-like isoform X2 [Corticium candelabrum]
MEDNSGWPETFGFRIGGGRPVVIIYIDEDGSARSAGLQIGDQIIELNGQNVQQLTVDELKFLAQQSVKVPPSLAVISRVKTLEIALPSTADGYAFTLRGNGPVFVRSVDVSGAAWRAGLRSGDLLLQVNGEDMQYASKQQIEKVVRECDNSLRLVVIGSGLTSLDSSSKAQTNRSRVVRYQKAKSFYQQMNYYLHGMDHKKVLLVLALKEFARNRLVDQLAHACVSVLTTQTERKLLKEIRSFISPKQHAAFDVLVRMDSDIMSSRSHGIGRRQTSQPDISLLSSGGLRSSSGNTFGSTPTLRGGTTDSPRFIRINRGSSTFGFSLGVSSPVCLTQIDKGSPAHKAGLKPGDQILEVNGLNVRNMSKANLVSLLKGSGTSPTLLVEQPRGSRMSPEASSIGLLGGRSSTTGYSRQVARQQSREFQSKMASLLTKGEKQAVASCLEKYKIDRNVGQLVQSLAAVLTTNEKVYLMHDICQLLPSQEQTTFDQEAAKVVGRFESQGPLRGGGSEDVEDVIYRVQGRSLGAEDMVVGRHRQHDLTRVIGVGCFDRLDTISEWEPESRTGTVTMRARVGSYSKCPRRLSTLSGDSDCAMAEVSEYGNAVPSPDSVSFASSFAINAVTSSTKNGLTPKDITSGNAQSSKFSTATTQEQPGVAHQSSSGSKLGSGVGTQVDTNSSVTGTATAGSQSATTTMTPTAVGATGASLGELLGKINPPTVDDAATVVLSSGPPPFSSPPPPPPPPPSPSLSSILGLVPPPPPLPGGVPPPPPMGGAATQKSRLKQVNWEKLSTSNLQDTVWAQLTASSELDELIELDEQFASRPQRKESSVKTDQIDILDSKKSYNISILIGHLRLSFEDIRDSVLAMDNRSFSQQHLRQMEAYAPEAGEMRAYEEFRGDTTKLSSADRFSMMMSTIPQYQERIRVMAFKSHFYDKVDEIEPDFEDIILASTELQNSMKFKKLLELILAIGNYMNTGNMRVGGASGFRIGYLTKLDSTKTSDNKSNLAHFLVKTVQTKYPEVLTVSDELKHMAAAAKVSTQTLASELNELKQGLADIQLKSEAYSRTKFDATKDRFVQFTTELVAAGRERLQSLLDLQARTTMEYDKTVRYFGEDPRTTRSDEFFAVFHQFLEIFERALQHNISKEEQKLEKEKREKEREEILSRRKVSEVCASTRNSTDEPDISGREELQQAVQCRKLDPSKLTALETKKYRSEGSGSLSNEFQTFLQQKRSEMKTVKYNNVSGPIDHVTQEGELNQVIKRRQLNPSKLADLDTKKSQTMSDTSPTDFRSVLARLGNKSVSHNDHLETTKHQSGHDTTHTDFRSVLGRNRKSSADESRTKQVKSPSDSLQTDFRSVLRHRVKKTVSFADACEEIGRDGDDSVASFGSNTRNQNANPETHF